MGDAAVIIRVSGVKRAEQPAWRAVFLPVKDARQRVAEAKAVCVSVGDIFVLAQ